MQIADPDRIAQLKRDTFAGSAKQLMIREMFENNRNEEPIAKTMARVTLLHYLGDTKVMTIVLSVTTMICFIALENIECMSHRVVSCTMLTA